MRLLTHNAYWFQGHPTRWGTERVSEVPEVVEALVALYRAVEPDVLCLQEVHAPRLAASVAEASGLPRHLHAPGGRRPDYGGLVACAGRATLRDCTRPHGQAPHERVHLRASIRAVKAKLEVACLHLPSNRFVDSREEGDAARVAELQRVLAEPPRPSLIAGDLNCQPDSAPYRFLLQAGYVDGARQAGGDAARARRVDYVWLDPSLARRLAHFAVLDTGPFVRADAEGTAWLLSDHPPLLVELR